MLSTPVDRVRTVDLTASPIHRLLGLTTVTVGTGTASTDGDEKLDLDGLPVLRARELRAELLRVAPATTGGAGGGEGDEAEVGPDGVPLPQPSAPRRTGRRCPSSPGWLRFAPFTSSGIVIAAALLGAASQLGSTVDFYDQLDPGAWSLSVPIWGAVVLGLIGLGVSLPGCCRCWATSSPTGGSASPTATAPGTSRAGC